MGIHHQVFNDEKKMTPMAHAVRATPRCAVRCVRSLSTSSLWRLQTATTRRSGPDDRCRMSQTNQKQKKNMNKKNMTQSKTKTDRRAPEAPFAGDAQAGLGGHEPVPADQLAVVDSGVAFDAGKVVGAVGGHKKNQWTEEESPLPP